MDLSNILKPLSWFNKVVGIQAKSIFGSSPTREWVAARLFYLNSTQKSDILDVNVTKTQLIAALEYLIKKGWHICITAACNDHHVDGSTNGFHNSAGAAIDMWPYTDETATTWIDASTETFRNFLKDCANAPYRMQVGLGGSAYSDANVAATGLSLDDASVFHDDIEDHVHLGVTFE